MRSILDGAHLESALDLGVDDTRTYEISEGVLLTTVHFRDSGPKWSPARPVRTPKRSRRDNRHRRRAQGPDGVAAVMTSGSPPLAEQELGVRGDCTDVAASSSGSQDASSNNQCTLYSQDASCSQGASYNECAPWYEYAQYSRDASCSQGASYNQYASYSQDVPYSNGASYSQGNQDMSPSGSGEELQDTGSSSSDTVLRGEGTADEEDEFYDDLDPQQLLALGLPIAFGSSRPEAKSGWGTADEEDDFEDDLDPQELLALGLPVAFGSSRPVSKSGWRRGRRKRRGKDRAGSHDQYSSACESPVSMEVAVESEGSIGHVASPAAAGPDLWGGLAAAFEDGTAVYTPCAAVWQEAYDPGSDSYYYYRESTQETQWEPPDEGYQSAPLWWSREWYHPQSQGHTSAVPDQASAGAEHASNPGHDLILPLRNQRTIGTGFFLPAHASECSASAQGSGVPDEATPAAASMQRAEEGGRALAAPVSGSAEFRETDARPVHDVHGPGGPSPSHADAEGVPEKDAGCPCGWPLGPGDHPGDGTCSTDDGTAGGTYGTHCGTGTTPRLLRSMHGGLARACGLFCRGLPLPNGSHTLLDDTHVEGAQPCDSATSAEGSWCCEEASRNGAGGEEARSPEGTVEERHAAGAQGPASASAGAVGIAKALAEGGELYKYWRQRYSLWSLYDHGIQMDEQGWYSATPEVIAQHHAERCGNARLMVLDAFAGVGGNAVQLAVLHRVVAVDINESRLLMAAHNAGLYGVQDSIEFICVDFFVVAAMLKADAVLMSPPWGGPEYGKRGKFFDLNNIGGMGVSLKLLVQKGVDALRNPKEGVVVVFLPRNTPLRALKNHLPAGYSCEVERAVLNARLKAVTLYIRHAAVNGIS